MALDKIVAPFDEDEVAALNRYQQVGLMHPFTCPNDSSNDLVATTDGWVCPHCDYTQDWAHAFMTDSLLFG